MEENIKQLVLEPAIIKIAIVGPECTGKTTLAQALARRYDTAWVPEFARDYLQKKFDENGHICKPEDMLPILYGQVSSENNALQHANQFLFTDTCALQTRVYASLYYNQVDPQLEKAGRKHKYDLFFLTQIVPWEKDDLRDRPNDRDNYFEVFRQELEQLDKPYVIITGNPEQRLAQASAILEDFCFAKSLGFTSHDFLQIREQGISLQDIEEQLGLLKRGVNKAELDRPAIIGDGILKLSEDEITSRADAFEKAVQGLIIEKFVPASGAASRMFKFLTEFLNQFDPENQTINAYINQHSATDLRVFLAGIEKFPFYSTIRGKLAAEFPDFESWDTGLQAYRFIQFMLDPNHFNYCNLPKAVLPFHKYQSHIATPIEEHLIEAATIAVSRGLARIHFTVSKEHDLLFKADIEQVRGFIEQKYNIKLACSFSHQDVATDTLALAADNSFFRNNQGRLVFRPGGHGALIHNLSARDADIFFIKNIDNVIFKQSAAVTQYKKALGHLLIEIRNQVFTFLRKIEQTSISEEDLRQMVLYVKQQLNVEIIEDFDKYTIPYQVAYIKEILNRPIRVCGMVKNEGEPGGGPFWVKDKKGIPRLQIVESSQIDFSNALQAEIAQKSTHFNPVDLVCSTKDYLGQPFDLSLFIDRQSGFIVNKNRFGRSLKAYELPGLWNGAMGKWITVFVEVPLVTFNPVKTVNDLLKAAHQDHG